jgi:hypothetical protein
VTGRFCDGSLYEWVLVIGSFCAGLLCDGSFCYGSYSDGTLCRGTVSTVSKDHHSLSSLSSFGTFNFYLPMPMRETI